MTRAKNYAFKKKKKNLFSSFQVLHSYLHPLQDQVSIWLFKQNANFSSILWHMHKLFSRK